MNFALGPTYVNEKFQANFNGVIIALQTCYIIYFSSKAPFSQVNLKSFAHRSCEGAYCHEKNITY